MPEASKPGNAAPQLIGASRLGEGSFDQFYGFLRRFRGERPALLHLFPETHRVAQLSQRQQTQPLMVFGEYKGFAARVQGVAVTLFDGICGFAARQAEVLGRNCQIGAGGEPYEVQGVGGRPGLIEIVHAPNQSAFLVAPRPEVLDVQVADGEHGRRFREVGANFWPKLNPAVESGAKEREGSFGHVGMFQGNVLANAGEAVREPALEVGCGFKDVHAECAGVLAVLNVGVLDARRTAAETGFINGEFGGELSNLFANALLDVGVADVGEDLGDPAADLLHLRFAHATCGDGRTAQANSATLHGGQRIEGNRVFVYGDAGAVESFFGVRSGDAAGVDFDQKQMVVRAAGDDAEAVLGDGGCHGFGVGNDLLLVFLEGRL